MKPYARAIGMAIGLCVAFLAGMQIQAARGPSLEVAAAGSAPLIDGDPGDAAWDFARPVDIAADQDARISGSEVLVRVRAVRDEGHAYLLLEWQDEPRDEAYLRRAWHWRSVRYAGGDTAAVQWRDGWWRLEVRRRLGMGMYEPPMVRAGLED